MKFIMYLHYIAAGVSKCHCASLKLTVPYDLSPWKIQKILRMSDFSYINNKINKTK